MHPDCVDFPVMPFQMDIMDGDFVRESALKIMRQLFTFDIEVPKDLLLPC